MREDYYQQRLGHADVSTSKRHYAKRPDITEESYLEPMVRLEGEVTTDFLARRESQVYPIFTLTRLIRPRSSKQAKLTLPWKRANPKWGLRGAQDWNRTSTAFRPLDPESSASTNSATWARSEVG